MRGLLILGGMLLAAGSAGAQCGSAVVGEARQPAVIQGLGSGATVRVWALGQNASAEIPDPCVAGGCVGLDGSPLCEGSGDCVAVTGVEWLDGACATGGFLPAGTVIVAEGTTAEDGGLWAAVVGTNPGDANLDLDALQERVCGGCSSEASALIGASQSMSVTVAGQSGDEVTLELLWSPPDGAAEALNESGASIVRGYSLWIARAPEGSTPRMDGDPAGWVRVPDQDGTQNGGYSTDTGAEIVVDLGGSDDPVWVAVGLVYDGSGDPGSDPNSVASGVISRGVLAVAPGGAAPQAVFQGPDGACTDTPVQWVDASVNADSWEWDFETDGTVDDTRRVPDPVVYGVAGEWVCTLTVKNSATPTPDTESHVIRIANAISGVAGDADGNGRADAADLAALIAELADGDGVALADRCQHWPTSDKADVTSDGQITPADLVALTSLL